MINEMSISADRLQLFKPNPKWFFKNHLGVHGIAHETRVLILSHLICVNAQDAPKADIDDLGWAAVLHDTQRQDDWEDVEHGLRASQFVMGLSPKKNTFTPQLRIRKVAHICKWHVPPDGKCPSFDDNLKVFKDADALDRWRIGDLDPDFLRLKTSVNFMEVSRNLWKKTRHLDHDENVFERILDIALKLNIIV